MTLENFKKTKTNYLVVFSILYILSFVFSIFICPYSREKWPFLYNSMILVFFIISLFAVYSFTDLFKENRAHLKKEKLVSKKFCIKKTIVIIIFSLFAVGRIIISILLRKKFDLSIPRTELIVHIISFIFGGIAEEVIFTGLLHEYLKKIKLPFLLNIFIVSFLFSLAHLDFSLAFFGIFIVRVIFLTGYYFYPSLIFFGIYHTLRNIIVYIMYI